MLRFSKIAQSEPPAQPAAIRRIRLSPNNLLLRCGDFVECGFFATWVICCRAARRRKCAFVSVVPMDDWSNPSLSMGAAAAVIVMLHMARPRLAGTTLVSVGAWGVVSMVAIGAASLASLQVVTEFSANELEAIHWMAACSTLCPMMALFGAKRPQDRGWQWIVLSLWVVLTLPAGKAFLLGRTVEISTIWWGFVLILIATGVLNLLPTRYWFSALCVGAAQVVLLLGYRTDAAVDPAVGIGLLVVAAMAAFWAASRVRPSTKPLECVWFDFRDMFGMVWALRIAEQLNKSSEMYDWGVTMRWDGLVDTQTGEPATELPTETAAAIVKSLRTMLRRFVSPEWLDARLPEHSDPVSPS